MIVYNGSPVELTGEYAGRSYVFPSQKKVQLKSYRSRHEVVHADDIGRKLAADLAPLGLRVIDEMDPQSIEELNQEAGKAFVEFVKLQIKTLNDFNLELASEGKGTHRPSKQLRDYRQKMLETARLLGMEEEDLVTDDQLQEVKANAIQQLQSRMQRVQLAIENGDYEEAKRLSELKAGISAKAPTVEAEIKADTETNFVEPQRPVGRRRSGK